MEPVVVGGQDLPDLAQSEDWDPAAVRSQGEVGPAILTDPPRSFPVLSGSFRFFPVHFGSLRFAPLAWSSAGVDGFFSSAKGDHV